MLVNSLLYLLIIILIYTFFWCVQFIIIIIITALTTYDTELMLVKCDSKFLFRFVVGAVKSMSDIEAYSTFCILGGSQE